MAAPTPTAIGTPAGIWLENGYQSLIVFAANTTISFWEKSVQPPGLDSGDAVDTTTMRNTTYRTMAPRHLITLKECKLKAAYDPNVYNQIVGLIGVRTTITIQFSDGSTLAFYGYMKDFTPDAMVDGTQPEADMTIMPTNYDPSGHAEAGPVLTSVSGT